MAARAPSDYDLSYSDEDLHAGEDIDETQPDLLLDNQQFILNRNRIIISDCWYPIEMDVAAWTTVLQLYTLGPDMCGTHSTRNIGTAHIYAWAENGTTDFDVRLLDTGGANNENLSVTTSQASKLWRGPLSGNLNHVSDGTLEQLDLDVRRTSGSGKLYIAGVFFYMNG